MQVQDVVSERLNRLGSSIAGGVEMGKFIRPRALLAFLQDSAPEERAVGVAAAVELCHLAQRSLYKDAPGLIPSMLIAAAIDCAAEYDSSTCNELIAVFMELAHEHTNPLAHGAALGFAVATGARLAGLEFNDIEKLGQVGLLLGEAMYQTDLALGKYHRKPSVDTVVIASSRLSEAQSLSFSLGKSDTSGVRFLIGIGDKLQGVLEHLHRLS